MSRQSFLDPAAAAGAGVGSRIELGEAEARHARVKRIALGEQVDVVDGAGLRLVCEVVASDAAAVVLEVLAIDDDRDAERPRVTLVQALSKQDRDLQAVESCVEIGIDAVIPWQADRSIVRWKDDRAAKAHAKWENQVVAAVKQSRRASAPPVEQLLTSKQLAARIRETTLSGGLALILHEEAQGPLPSRLEAWLRSAREVGQDMSLRPEVLLVVGPEGGISPQELGLFAESGASSVVLGTNVLRASTAGSVALVLVLAALGEFA